MASITSAGVGSGLDLESIIEVTIKAESEVKTKQLNAREINYTTELSGVGTFKAALDTFNTALATLGEEETYASRKVQFSGGISEDDQAFNVDIDSSMQAGEFSIEVSQLASGSKLQSSALNSVNDTVGAGNLTLSAGDSEFSIEVLATDTLEDIRNKINQASENFGVSANIVNSDAGAVLTYSSSKTGDGNTLSVAADDDSLASIASSAPSSAGGVSILQNAVNAETLINGQAVSSSSNTLNDKIQGTTITLNKVTTEAQTFNVSVDSEVAVKAVDEFIGAYNTLKEQLDTLSNPTSGMLASDSNIRSVEQQLQRMFTNDLGGSTEIQSLMDLGITFNRFGEMEKSATGIGTLASGQDTFDDTLENNYSAFQNFFSSDDGLVKKVDGLIDLYTSSSGSLIKREESLNESLESIEIDRESLNERLVNLEASLRSKYASLDSLIAQYQTSSSYISSILTSVSTKK
jgi:flagellar hook-associated protein 2